MAHVKVPQRPTFTGATSLAKTSYIPPLRFRILTPAYDVMVRWTSGETAFRAAIVDALKRSQFANLVDLGCGTGSLVAILSATFPHARITGIDADQAALDIARMKLGAVGADVRLLHGNARCLPLADGAIGAVTSSLFFHHLDDAAKRLVLKEVHRCLAPDGVFVVADWDRAGSFPRRFAFNAVRMLDGLAVTRSHANGRFGRLLANAGFCIGEQVAVPALLGQVTTWTCRKTISPDAAGRCCTTGKARSASAGSPASASR
jgi:ubiquinone/menaquinone biosynthesis C-methylase UbiE